MEEPRVWGAGSQPGKAGNIERCRVFYSHLLHDDFWGAAPMYDEMHFKRFFRLSNGLFDQIVVDLVEYDNYFRLKSDAAGKLGFMPIQKTASSVWLLTSGVSLSDQDDTYRLGASTGLESMKCFCQGVNEVYSATALPHPTFDNINRLLDEGSKAGFPGCIGAVDCMHWKWKNCPSAWKGMFQGGSGVATVVLEAIADSSCRFWHFNFGSPGTLNDISILDRSPLFNNAVRGEAPHVDFVVNGHNNNSTAYWLADGIYPKYACFVKTLPNTTTRMQKFFATAQEAKRKDIERAFGILQARFHILTTGCCLWDALLDKKDVMKTCVVLHNLIIDYERENGLDPTYIAAQQEYVPVYLFVVQHRRVHQTHQLRKGSYQHISALWTVVGWRIG